jgi:hypothetical protein
MSQMTQMMQMAEDLSRSASESPQAILNVVQEGRCEETRGFGRALCDKDLWPSVSSVDGLVLSHQGQASASKSHLAVTAV